MYIEFPPIKDNMGHIVSTIVTRRVTSIAALPPMLFKPSRTLYVTKNILPADNFVFTGFVIIGAVWSTSLTVRLCCSAVIFTEFLTL